MIDGKDVRGASPQVEDRRCILVAAVEHASGTVLGPERVEDKSSEIPAVRKLAKGLPLEGRAVTLDALHVQCETARSLVADHNADYVITAIKGNQPELLEDLRAIDWHAPECAALEYAEVDKGHGRIETRRCRAVDLTGEEWNEHCRLPFRRQAVRIERQRHILKSGKITTETAYCITSLSPTGHSPAPASPAGRRLRRRPLPGACPQPAPQSRMHRQRRHLHRSPSRPAPVPAAGPPPFCIPPARRLECRPEPRSQIPPNRANLFRAASANWLPATLGQKKRFETR